jgi:hypothetical protein
MLNTLLTLGYFLFLGIIVAARDQFLDDDLMVFGVAVGALALGLALWIFTVQRHR